MSCARGCVRVNDGVAYNFAALLDFAAPIPRATPISSLPSGGLMQQRQLRLGDIVDDYCPRERRVTNHAIVAMVEQDVKQTRCTTCDTEHEYKQAKVPPQRKKKAVPGALYQEVLAGMPRKPATSGSELSDEPSPPSAKRIGRPPYAAAAEPEPGSGGRGRRPRASAADPGHVAASHWRSAHASGPRVYDSATARQTWALPPRRWGWRGPPRPGRAGLQRWRLRVRRTPQCGSSPRRLARPRQPCPPGAGRTPGPTPALGGAAARNARSSLDASSPARPPDG